MSLYRPPRLLSPGLINAFVNASLRTQRHILTHQGSNERFGILGQLVGLSAGWNGPGIPYNDHVFNPKKLLPISGSWAIFQLYEALQLRAEWQFLQPDDVTIEDVLAAFNEIGSEDGNIFPECNTTPAARRAAPKIPPLNGMGWAITFEGTNQKIAAFIPGRGTFTEANIPPNVFFNPATKRWDVKPT